MGTQVVSAGPQARKTIQSAEAAPTHTGVSRIAMISLSHFTAADYSRKRLAVKTLSAWTRTKNAGDGRQGGEGQKSQGGVKHRITGQTVCNKSVTFRQGFFSPNRTFLQRNTD